MPLITYLGFKRLCAVFGKKPANDRFEGHEALVQEITEKLQSPLRVQRDA